MKHISHFGWEIEIGSNDEKNILQNEIKVIGPKGTCLLFDGEDIAFCCIKFHPPI